MMTSGSKWPFRICSLRSGGSTLFLLVEPETSLVLQLCKGEFFSTVKGYASAKDAFFGKEN